MANRKIRSAPKETATDPPVIESRFGKWLHKARHVKGAVVAVASVGAVLSGLYGYWAIYQGVKGGTPSSIASKVTAVDAGPLSVVVLPFANLTGEASQEYVADGLTASITSDLSRIRDAFIVNASTAFAYKGKPAIARQIGKELGVHFVLHGSVQRSGNKIRISAQLADAASNAQLWSEIFEGDQSELFELQDRVTTRIGNSIGREMVIVAARDSETRKSSPKAADLMLRARALSLKPQSLKNFQQMEAWYREVLALEPNNVGAMVGAARSMVLEPANFGSGMDATLKQKKFGEGRDLALKAKELDPDIPDIYSALGAYAITHDDFEGDQRAAETRAALDPKNPFAIGHVAQVYWLRAEPKKAIELLIQALNLNPKHPSELIYIVLSRVYFMQGDGDAAIESALKAIEISPGNAYPYALLAMGYVLKGNDAKAREAVAHALRLEPAFRLDEVTKAQASYPAAYKEYYVKTFLPAWRKAGLPE